MVEVNTVAAIITMVLVMVMVMVIMMDVHNHPELRVHLGWGLPSGHTAGIYRARIPTQPPYSRSRNLAYSTALG